MTMSEVRMRWIMFIFSKGSESEIQGFGFWVYAWQSSGFSNAWICSGTPSGVGPVKAGQRMKAGITGLAEMSFDVKARKALR